MQYHSPTLYSDKSVTVAAFVTPDKEKEAKEAGADIVGLDSLIKDIKEGKNLI